MAWRATTVLLVCLAVLTVAVPENGLEEVLDSASALEGSRTDAETLPKISQVGKTGLPVEAGDLGEGKAQAAAQAKAALGGEDSEVNGAEELLQATEGAAVAATAKPAKDDGQVLAGKGKYLCYEDLAVHPGSTHKENKNLVNKSLKFVRCDQHAMCDSKNLACTCNEGYRGDGTNCERKHRHPDAAHVSLRLSPLWPQTLMPCGRVFDSHCAAALAEILNPPLR